ncbi:MAG: hypothetical protein O2871_02065 [bacterium]|nr:hypothetical protein [bacterium]
MKPKTFFIIIIIFALAYLLYWFATRPEKKFGEITVENSKYTTEIKKTPKLVFQTNTNVFGKNLPVYKIEKKLQGKLSSDQAKDIANIVNVTENESTVDLGNTKIFIFKKENTSLGVSDYGFVQYYLTENIVKKSYDKKAIVELITNSGLNKVVPLPENYVVNISDVEADGATSDLAQYLKVFSIIPMVDKTFSYRDTLAQSLYYGSIKPIVVDNAITGYSIEISTWYSLVFDILGSSTYNTISLDETLKLLQDKSDKIFVEIDSKEVYNPIIDTNSLNISKVEIIYFVQDKLLIPYFHFEGQNEFNQNDSGVVNIYVPAI